MWPIASLGAVRYDAQGGGQGSKGHGTGQLDDGNVTSKRDGNNGSLFHGIEGRAEAAMQREGEGEGGHIRSSMTDTA